MDAEVRKTEVELGKSLAVAEKKLKDVLAKNNSVNEVLSKLTQQAKSRCLNQMAVIYPCFPPLSCKLP